MQPHAHKVHFAQVADSKTVWGLYKGGCTLQVHQPQRFQEGLARLCSGLEQRLGCLVGINAYLTPPGSQVTSHLCSSSSQRLQAALSCSNPPAMLLL